MAPSHYLNQHRFFLWVSSYGTYLNELTALEKIIYVKQLLYFPVDNGLTIESNRMARQLAETLVEVRVTLADIRGITK